MQTTSALAFVLLAPFFHIPASADSPSVTGRPVGLPMAHWSDDFSFGIQFSAPVSEIRADAIHPADAVVAYPDNSSGTRWRFRATPAWSADMRIRIGVNPDPATGPECTGGNVCSQSGSPLEAAVVINVPARPPDRTWVSCDAGSVWAGAPDS